jgi:hypothetical protein
MKNIAHIIRRILKRELAVFVVAMIVLALFLSFLPFLSIAGDSVAHSFRKAFDKELSRRLTIARDNTLNQITELSTSPEIIDAFATHNPEIISPLLKKEAEARGANIMLSADAEGLVMTRLYAPDVKNDYLHNTAWGRHAMEGESFVTFEVGKSIPLVLIASHPILKDGKFIGTLAGGRAIDSAFAEEFRERFFKNIGLALYSKEEGVIGGVFPDPEMKKLLPIFFGGGSEWLERTEKEHRFSINGKHYLISNIPFQGVNAESPGGILLLVPIWYGFSAFLIAFFAAFLFLLFSIFVHHFYQTEGKISHARWRRTTIVCLAVIFGYVFWISYSLLLRQSIPLKDSPYTIYNSTLDVYPAAGVLSVHAEHRISIRVVTGGESVNVVRAVLTYDPEKIRVNEVLTENSFCAPWMFFERTIDNDKGRVDIACGLPSPGFSGPKGIIAELLISPLEEGDAFLAFDSTDTQVLANDGLSTNVLRYAMGGGYKFISEYSGNQTFFVVSPTHPNQLRWYNSSSTRFVWRNKGEGYQYWYTLSESPLPPEDFSRVSSTKNTRVSLPSVSEGVHYFHVAAEKNGAFSESATHRIMIDITPPQKPLIQASHNEAQEGEIIRFTFEGKDALSGMQKNYYIKIDDGALLPTGSFLFFAFPEGKHIFTVRIFDNAGNFSESSIPLNIHKSGYSEGMLLKFVKYIFPL